MAIIDSARRIEMEVSVRPTPQVYDAVSAAELILRRYGARAISILTSARQMDDGRWISPRLSANDCYVALDEACRKVGRVALRKYTQDAAFGKRDLEECLPAIFPDPVAYLAGDQVRHQRRGPDRSAGHPDRFS